MVWARTQEWGVSGEHTSPRILSGMCGAFKLPLPYLYNPPLQNLTTLQTSSSPADFTRVLVSSSTSTVRKTRKSNNKTRQTIPSPSSLELQESGCYYIPETVRFLPNDCNSLGLRGGWAINSASYSSKSPTSVPSSLEAYS